MSLDWKQIVKTVAPALGSALGGPAAGIATKFLADKFLGNSNATEQDIAQAIQSATPEQLIKIKELDNDFKLEMRAYDSDDYKTEVDDRVNARNKVLEELKNGYRDYTPTIITIIVYFGLFCFIYLLIVHDIDSDVRDILYLAMGFILNEVKSINAFHFGSTASSRMKDLMLYWSTPQDKKE
jgi:hypothetical protein